MSDYLMSSFTTHANISRQSPAVSELVKQVSTVPYADLPSVFAQWPQAWPFPRGDLNNWIEPLDRFDSILQSFNSRYGLDKGPQTVPFGSSLLIEGSPGIDEQGLKERGFGADGDRVLVEAILVCAASKMWPQPPNLWGR